MEKETLSCPRRAGARGQDGRKEASDRLAAWRDFFFGVRVWHTFLGFGGHELGSTCPCESVATAMVSADQTPSVCQLPGCLRERKRRCAGLDIHQPTGDSFFMGVFYQTRRAARSAPCQPLAMRDTLATHAKLCTTYNSKAQCNGEGCASSRRPGARLGRRPPSESDCLSFPNSDFGPIWGAHVRLYS